MAPRKRRLAALIVLTGLSAIVAAGIGISVGLAVASVRNTEEITRSTRSESALPSVLYDRHGRVIAELFSEEKRTLVSIEEVPRHLIYALITREDQSFFEHRGFDLGRTISAAVHTIIYEITNGRFGYFSGASTITQQLAKKMYTDESNTITRKLKELWWALQLERHLTKYEILEEYLNRMPFGHGNYGVATASDFFFRHPPSELTIAESALLAIQPSSPSFGKYSPFQNPEEARARQREILNQMVELGYATREEVDSSFQQYWANHDFTRVPTSSAFLERLANDKAPWFTEHVRIRLDEELLLGSANIYADGYRVYTTLDLDYQQAAQRRLWEGVRQANVVYQEHQAAQQQHVDRVVGMIDALALSFDVPEIEVGSTRVEQNAEEYYLNRLVPLVDTLSMMFEANEQDPLRIATRESHLELKQIAERTQVQGAIITIENQTGHILAMVGGPPFESEGQFNRAIDARRQPGSSFKPLYYSAGINSGAITPATVFLDAPVSFLNDDGTYYTPDNYKGSWDGPTRVRWALARSMNVVSIRVLDRIGFTDALNTAGRLMGFNEQQMAARGFVPNYPVGLGTVSASPYDMARAFAVFPNGGREVIPMTVRYIEDRRGVVVAEPERELNERLVAKGEAAQIISPQAAYIMTDILQTTVEGGTLWSPAHSAGGFDGMPMGGKTGTTQNWSDAWTIGFSPYMTTAIWIGFDRGAGNSLGTMQTGSVTAGPIWAAYMKEIHAGLEPREFERPATGLVEQRVTAARGKTPPPGYEGEVVQEIFIEGTVPTEVDDSLQIADNQRAQVAAAYSRRRPSALPGARLNTLSSARLRLPSPDEVVRFDSDTNPFIDAPADSADPSDDPESIDGEDQSPDVDGQEPSPDQESPAGGSQNPLLDGEDSTPPDTSADPSEMQGADGPGVPSNAEPEEEEGNPLLD